MLWLKALHIGFVVTWFAGLFYLPRLFVYHAAAQDPTGIERLQTMERRLFGLMSVAGTLAIGFGIALLVLLPAYLDERWMQVKLVLVALLAGYHLLCHRLMRDLARGLRRSPTWYRWYNEAPTVFLFAIVILVEVRPF